MLSKEYLLWLITSVVLTGFYMKYMGAVFPEKEYLFQGKQLLLAISVSLLWLLLIPTTVFLYLVLFTRS